MKKSAILLLVLIVALFASQHYLLKDVESVHQNLYLVGEISSNMAKCRNIEKQLLEGRAYENLIKQFHQCSDDLRRSITRKELHLTRQEQKHLINQLKIYKTSLEELVPAVRENGFHQNEGLRGQLRRAIHQVEKAFRELGNHELLSDVLMLRRHEKDFLIRLDLNYIERYESQLEKTITTLNSYISDPEQKETLTYFLNNYQSNLAKVVDNKKLIGLTPATGLRGEMNLATDSINQTIAQLRTISAANYTNIDRTLTLVNIIALLCIVVFTIALYYNLKLSRSLMEETLERKHNKETNRIKSQFLQTLSREFKTPLNAIIGFSNILISRDQNALSTREAEAIKNIVIAGNQIEQKINQLIDYTHLDSNEYIPEIRRCNLIEVINLANDKLRNIYRSENWQLHSKSNSSRVLVSTDESMLLKIVEAILETLINLIPKVDFDINITDGDKKEIMISATPGVPKEKLRNLHEIFSAESFSLEMGKRDFGVSLNLAKKMADLLAIRLTLAETSETTTEIKMSFC